MRNLNQSYLNDAANCIKQTQHITSAEIMMYISIILSIIVVILTPVILWFIKISKYSSLRNVPGPRPLPIIGNANEIGKTTVDMLQSFIRLQKIYGTFYKLWLGFRLHIILAKPEYVEHILNSNVHLAKSDGYDLFRPLLGDGLLLSSGAKWRRRRKLITPTFHFKILEEFSKVFNKQFNILLDILTKEVQNKPDDDSIDIFNFINLASLDVICETAFGTPIQAQLKGNIKYVEALKGFLDTFMLRFFSAWMRNPFLFRFSPRYRKWQEHMKILHEFTRNVIKNRKEELGLKRESTNVSDDGVKKRAALLDMLLEASSNGEPLTDEDIQEEVDTFMFEGHDTTTSGITYSLYAICENNEVQRKVYEELIDVLGPDGKSEITLAQINELKYLDMVVKEAMRYYSPVPLIERMLEEDWEIDGITIPKGTNITMFIYGMNYAPEVFPNPEKFDPERFLPEKQSSRNNYAYIPFSAGSRNCIGQKFALYELKTCICKILLNFELILDPSFTPESGMAAVLKPKNGIRMKLKFRK